MVRPTGFEPMAPRLGIWCSILLSYGRPACFLSGPWREGKCCRPVQLDFPGGTIGNGKGASSMPSSNNSLASASVAWP